MTGPHGGLAAPAHLGGGQLREPVESGVVDGLSDVDAEVETAVVASSEDQHELPGLVLHLGDLELRVLLLEYVGIDESGLVPQVLCALAEVLGEEQLCLLFQDVGLVGGNAVPKLRLAFVQVVDGGQVEVLPVPAEEGLPGADVAVGGGDSPDVDVDCVVQDGIQFVEVPGACGVVHEGVEQISAVQGGREDDIFPKLLQFHGYHGLRFVGRQPVGNFVEYSHLHFVLLVAHGFFLDVQAFVDAALPEDVLLDGAVDHQVLQLLGVVGGLGLPFWWGDNLNKRRQRRIGSRPQVIRVSGGLP